MRDAQKGWVVIAGLGPGDERMVIPEVQEVLAEATDVVGYIPYVERIAPRAGLTLHASDNRVEVDRATQAMQMAAEGKRVVVVSSGDPGVFAMASAVFEALEDGSKAQPAWLDLDIRVLPGITAMLAAAAAIPSFLLTLTVQLALMLPKVPVAATLISMIPPTALS